MRKRRRCNGMIPIAFGIGLFLAVCFPSKCLVVILTVMIILCGICLCKK